MASDQDDGNLGVDRLDPSEQFEAIDARHTDIRDDDPGEIAIDLLQRLKRVGQGVDIDPGKVE